MTAPYDVVIGATDLDIAGEFLGRIDFIEVDRGVVDGSLGDEIFGGPEARAWRRLLPTSAAMTARGGITLVHTDVPRPARVVTASGPLAVDVYTRDIDASVARLTEAGVMCGHVGTLDLGPLVMRQCEVIAPDGWRLVLVEANVRRPSLLDTDEDALHSEVHSVLWTVPSIVASEPDLTAYGLTQTHVFPIRHPELSQIIGLPAPDTELTMNLMVDEEQSPIRVELCQFAEHPSQPLPDGPLMAGVWALSFCPSFPEVATTSRTPDGIRRFS